LKSFNADRWKIALQRVVLAKHSLKAYPTGRFEEVSSKGEPGNWWPWCIATGDFDNDGYEDVFLPSGCGFRYGYWPNAPHD